MEVSGQLHISAVLPSGEKHPVTFLRGGWVGPRTGLDAVAKRKIPYLNLPGIEQRTYSS
jgi:hypothetical protein